MDSNTDENITLTNRHESHNSNGKNEEDTKKSSGLIFGVEDKPPTAIVVFYSLQVAFSIVAGPLGACYIIYNQVCAAGHEEVLAQLVSTSLFIVGVSTFIQVTFGVRLPITQGSSFLFLPPVISMMQTEQWKCPPARDLNGIFNDSGSSSGLNISIDELEPWKPRIAEISGSLALASLLQIVLGSFGLIGFMTRYVGPLTITPTVALIGIVFYDAINHAAKHQWGVTLFTTAMTIIFAFIVVHKLLPLPSWNRKRGWYFGWYPLLGIFANILAVFCGWILCWILTVAGALPSNPDTVGYFARTDAKSHVMGDATWFYFPYPGRWGPITVGPAVFVGFLASTLGTIIESTGDYYATAKVCHLPPPPKHALNRGIALEGFAGIMAGLVGACHPTTSYSNVMGFIAYTGMGSRITWQVGSLVFILCGLCGKFGAVLAMVPDPVVGGIMLITLGMCFSIAFTNLEQVDIKSGRTQVILGLAVVSALCSVMYLKDVPDAFNTGSTMVDQVLYVIFSNGPLMGGIIGCFLDNIIPGTDKERGLSDFNMSLGDDLSKELSEAYVTYELPYSHVFKRYKILAYLPFMPTYEERDFSCNKQSHNKQKTNANEEKLSDIFQSEREECLSVV